MSTKLLPKADIWDGDGFTVPVKDERITGKQHLQLWPPMPAEAREH